MARNKGAKRGCATLVKRICDDCNAANSGWTLPVSCDCCWARRMADSISTTKFSSRERDRLCIKSSSCARCNDTSLNLASVTARRAAVSRASSSACLALTRASTAWVDTSEVCLASISWMPVSLNTVHTETKAPINASAATPPKTHLPKDPCQTDFLASVGTSVLVEEDGLSAGSVVMPMILMRPTHLTARVAFVQH